MIEPIRFTGDAVVLLDQRQLPHTVAWVTCRTATETADAIRAMVVRGAPAIGIAAAYGLALAVSRGEDRGLADAVLRGSRPTAVNLMRALDRLSTVAPADLAAAAKRWQQEELATCRAIGEHGAALLPKGAHVYHHCNTGALATGAWGTALGIVRSAFLRDPTLRVWVGETRPWLQGARLTAWELLEEGIPATLVVDGAAAHLFANGEVDAVLVGCDRVARNGDVANKIGTHGLAVAARHYGVPFYVAMPTSTLDRTLADGSAIPIEERAPAELYGWGDARWAPAVPAYNPAFDVTPAALVTAWITERGVWRTPFPAQAI